MRNIDDPLVLQICGFLNVIVQGIVPTQPHVQKEAGELLEKLGNLFEDGEQLS